jgi:hypothetical protein
LTGKHQDLACEKCHPRVRTASAGPDQTRTLYRPLPEQCSDCHKDPHRHVAQSSCDQCHSSKTFEMKGFNHFETSFPLSGRHASLSCQRCHSQVDWNGKLVLAFDKTREECQECHESPHRSQYAECGRCHITTTWRISDF